MYCGSMWQTVQFNFAPSPSTSSKTNDFPVGVEAAIRAAGEQTCNSIRDELNSGGEIAHPAFCQSVTKRGDKVHRII